MTHPPVTLEIALLCEPGTYCGSIAPFIDLARLSRQMSEGSTGGPDAPCIEIDLLHEASLAEPPIAGSRPISFESTDKIYAVVILPSGGKAPSGDLANRPLIAWLNRQHAQGAMIGAIGSGVLAPVAAGLLDGGPASIPPRFGRLIRARYPHVRLAHAGALAEAGRVVTAAEPCSIFALIVVLTRRFHSHGLAERYRRIYGVSESNAADEYVLPARTNQDILVAEARGWIMAHMHDDIDTASIAARFHVGARTLTRRFQRSTGATPAQFVRKVRLDAACSMLHRTGFSIEQIAHLVGYRDVGFFRALFRRSTGETPRDYRMAAQAGRKS